MYLVHRLKYFSMLYFNCYNIKTNLNLVNLVGFEHMKVKRVTERSLNKVFPSSWTVFILIKIYLKCNPPTEFPKTISRHFCS